MIEYIHNYNDLFKLNRKGIYELVEDIDCEGKSISKIIGDFSGIIDGAGHVIKNLVLCDEIWGDEQTLALFYTMSRAEIRDIKFENLKIVCDDGCFNPRVGALAGICTDCKIINVTVSVINDSNREIPLVYEASNCELQNNKIVCNGEEAPEAKYF